jgi:hypothetical protein
LKTAMGQFLVNHFLGDGGFFMGGGGCKFFRASLRFFGEPSFTKSLMACRNVSSSFTAFIWITLVKQLEQTEPSVYHKVALWSMNRCTNTNQFIQFQSSANSLGSQVNQQENLSISPSCNCRCGGQMLFNNFTLLKGGV